MLQLVLALVGSVGVAAWFGVRALLVRRVGIRVASAMADPGNDLRALDRELLSRALEIKMSRRRGTAPMQQEALTWLEGEVRLLRAMVALERGDLTVAREELIRAEAKPGHERLPSMRMQLSLGEKPTPTLEQLYLTTELKSFPPLLMADTVAQIALAAGGAVTALESDSLPLTRARALALLGRDDEADAILKAAHPSRVDAMCRMYPEEAATSLALRLKSEPTPYR